MKVQLTDMLARGPDGLARNAAPRTSPLPGTRRRANSAPAGTRRRANSAPEKGRVFLNPLRCQLSWLAADPVRQSRSDCPHDGERDATWAPLIRTPTKAAQGVIRA